MTDGSSLPPHIDPDRSDKDFWKQHKERVDKQRNKTVEELSKELDIKNILQKGENE